MRASPWLLAAGLLELLGRNSPHELIDAVGVTILGAGLFLLAARTEPHWRIPFQRRMHERWRSFAAGWRFERGLDLRGAPPLTGRYPKRICDFLFVTSFACIILVVWRDAWPTDVRLGVRSVSGLLWFALIGPLWCLLLAGSFGACAVCLDHLGSVLTERGCKAAIRRNVQRCAAAALCLAIFALATTQARGWAVLILAVVGLASALCMLITMRRLRYIWRQGGGPLSSAGVGIWEAASIGLLILPAVVLILVSGGERLFVAGPPETGLTAWIGAAFAWSMALCWGALLSANGASSVLALLRGPVLLKTPPVYLLDAPTAERGRLRAACKEAGFRAVFPRNEAPPRAVVLRVKPGETSAFDPWASSWPRVVSAVDFGEPALRESLRRRTSLQLRREVRQGFERLLRPASRVVGGSGLWLAPHLWFVSHATRDLDGEGSEEVPVGPPSWKLMSRAARGHLAQMLEELEIDFLFLEDGVGIRRCNRVITLLFEAHDRVGPHPFERLGGSAYIPGVRLIVHDLDPDAPFRSSKYPEPETTNLSRARVLQIFRDRGGDDDAPVTSEPRTSVDRDAPLLVN